MMLFILHKDIRDNNDNQTAFFYTGIEVFYFMILFYPEALVTR